MVVLTNSRNGYPLIIEELQAWSQANQLGRPKLVGVYTGLRTGARVAIALLMAVSAVLAVTLARRLRPRDISASLRRRSTWVRRLAALAAGALLLAGWWLLLREVLGVFLPATTPWLGLVVTIAGVLMLLLAASPGPATPGTTGAERSRRDGAGTVRTAGSASSVGRGLDDRQPER